MKKISILALTLASLFATQGDNLIGAGVKSRAAAGAAFTKSYGVESLFLNPSQIVRSQSNEASFGITLFMPDVHGKNQTAWYKSSEDFETIPYLGLIQNIDETSSWGIGLFSVSGMGVDYSDTPPSSNLANVKTNLAYAKLSLVYAKQFDNLTLGAGLDGAYGRLKIATAFSPLPANFCHDVGVGYHIGADYAINKNINIAAIYTSKVAMRYKSVYDFDNDRKKDHFKLTQPAQYSLAVGLKKSNWHTEIAFGKILWSRASGYKEFAWQDQNVYSMSVDVAYEKLLIIAGASYASKVIKPAKFSNPTQAFFNLIGFPAISQSHLSLGLSYHYQSNWRFNTALVYAPKKVAHYGPLAASNKQFSVSFGVDYLF
ncbi:OmpP1/FadL family transporter [Nitratiruptor sp. YY09-18]|uniref:OmpP1/FadL family transporter n=1 Tax=Nitratiruptor sp. YY09-18 TaxID=2724901 RepID=UPI00191602EC|nr:outer membrane protein transport protein [Nitratiruptor sp. YY09-18]BCD67980.1 long-chain fatty acid transport protein [Nitratiruptor sp. YY09-18]